MHKTPGYKVFSKAEGSFNRGIQLIGAFIIDDCGLRVSQQQTKEWVECQVPISSRLRLDFRKSLLIGRDCGASWNFVAKRDKSRDEVLS